MTLCCRDYDTKSAAVRLHALCDRIIEQQGMPPTVLLHVRGIQHIADELMAAGRSSYETKGAS